MRKYWLRLEKGWGRWWTARSEHSEFRRVYYFEIMQKSSVSRLLSLIISTVVIYQSAVVAPIINISLPVDAAAKFLRAIWPIFFALIGLLGVVGAMISRKERVGAAVNVATALSMAICYGLVPFINEARDSENLGVWKGLHAGTVTLTFITLIIQLWFLSRWYKLAPQGNLSH